MSASPSAGSRLRMAVIGCGPIGKLHAGAIASSSQATLVAVCDPDAVRSNETAAQFRARAHQGIEALFGKESLDAVTVATPDHLHCQPTLAAIAAGCHVFCEKPLATDPGDALRMVSAADKQGVHLAVDYNRRYAFGYRQAYEWFSEQRIGRFESASVRVTDPTPPGKVARNPYVMLTTLLTHHFDLVRWFGGDVRRLRAGAGDVPAGELLRAIDLTIELSSGAQATIVGRYRDDQPHTAEWMALHGTAGTIVIEDIARRVIRSGHAAHECVVREREQASCDAIGQSIIAHMHAFIDQIARGDKPPVSGRDGLIGMQLAAAAVESIATGKTIEVESA